MNMLSLRIEPSIPEVNTMNREQFLTTGCHVSVSSVLVSATHFSAGWQKRETLVMISLDVTAQLIDSQ